MSTRGAQSRWALMVLTGVLLAACRNDMQDQPRYEPFAHSAFFDDERASRPLVPGTVARGHLNLDTALYRGQSDGAPLQAVPVPVTRDLLARGQQRYDIYCSPCHDRVGTGGGMIVQRGFKRPESFHAERLRTAPAGYFFQVMTNGFGVMSSYAVQVPVHDRWAIVAYIRALQLSQRATMEDVPEAERQGLERSDG